MKSIMIALAITATLAVGGCASTHNGSTTSTSTTSEAQVKRLVDARFSDRADRIALRNSDNGVTMTVPSVTVVSLDADTGTALVRQVTKAQSNEFRSITQTRTSLWKVKFNPDTGYLRSVHQEGG